MSESTKTTAQYGVSHTLLDGIAHAGVQVKVSPWLICGVGAIFYLYEYFLRILPSLITNELQGSFHIAAGTVGHLSAFYYYAYIPMQLPVGLLMDRYGPRRLLTLACFACALGSFLFSSFAITPAEMGRFLIGFGSAFAFVGVMKLISIWLPRERFAMFSGMAIALGMIGAGCGDISLSLLVKALGWRDTVTFSAVFGAILTLCIWFVIRDKCDINSPAERATARERKLDLGKFAVELLQLACKPQIWLTGLIGALLYLPASAFAELWGIPYLELAYNLSHLGAAKAISFVFFGWAVGGPVIGWMSDEMCSRRIPYFVGSVLSTLVVCAIIFVPDLPLPALYAALFAFGFVSSAQILVFAIGRELSPAHLTATAIALINMLVMVSGFFQPIIGHLLERGWDGAMLGGVPMYSAENYRFALSVVPIGGLLAAVLTLFLRETGAKVRD